MSIKFDQTVVLIGVVGKKGNGVLDNGERWETDRVELHCVVPFPESDTMAHGQTVMQYNVQDFNAHYERAKQCLDQTVTLHMEMQPAKKLGAAPKMVCIGFSSKPDVKRQHQQQAAG